jgi:N-acetylmuramoyl-L-alanine amidase
MAQYIRRDANPEDVIAATLYAEARGESDEGKRAVVHVINNRARENRPYFGGSDHRSVCLHPNQFECWNGRNNIEINEPEAFRRCQQIVREELRRGYDPTGGANHYNNPNKEGYPSWTQNCTTMNRIGNHQFYKSN